MENTLKLLNKRILDRGDIVSLLKPDDENQRLLFEHAASVKEKSVGNKVFFRGLIEFSNICAKDCLYCGIRNSNTRCERYNLSDKEILESVQYAYEQKYASIVLQSGELNSKAFVRRIGELLKKIHRKTGGGLRITLSTGEQSEDTYRYWYNCGAHRYLLRIETTNPDLYRKLHPDDDRHRFSERLNALELLKKTGYQTGTGVMIGLPFQTYDDLAADLLFMKEFGIDMVGMGPYIEHYNTPLNEYREYLLSLPERLNLSLRMVALLRILMPDINIAAATALQSIEMTGREKALMVGANVIMPNITPGKYRDMYLLYENKPCTSENIGDCTSCLEARIRTTGNNIGWGEWGDSRFFLQNHYPY